MKKKILLRIVLILVILWLVLLGVLYFASGKYRDHAIAMLKVQVNRYLLSEIRINKNDIHLSLFKNFPYVSLDLHNILLKSAPGLNNSEFRISGSDTLLFAEKVSLNFNIRKLIAKKYDLRQIEIHGASINLLTDFKGRNNYDIIKTTTKDTISGDSVNFDLRKVTFRDTKINYEDIQSRVLYRNHVAQANMTGNFRKDEFLINLQLQGEHNYLFIKESVYSEDEPIELNLSIQRQNTVYFVRKSDLNIYGVKFNVEGKYNTRNDEYSINFSCNSVSLQRTKATLSKFWSKVLVLSPQNGDLNLRGIYNGQGNSNPSFYLQFEVKNGVFKNSEKDVRITDVYVKGSFTNGAKRNALTSFLKIDSLSAQSGNSILFVKGNLLNFNSPIFEGRIRGYIELQKLLIIEPLAKKFTLSGIAKGGIQAKGSLPSLTTFSNHDLQRIKMNGMLQLEEAYIKSLTNAIPASTLSGTVKIINLMEVNFENIKIQVGKSDLLVDGDVTNLPYFITDKSAYPVYRCKVSSNEFHVEDFLPGSEGDKNEPFKIEFPDSLRIYAEIGMKSFSFGKFKASDVSGIFTYSPKSAFIRNFAMKTQGGTVTSDMRIDQEGDYIVTQNDATLKHVDMGDLFYAFNEFGQTVITHEYIDGYLSGNLHVKATWDLFLNPVYKPLELTAQATIDEGELINYEPMMGLSDFIEVEELEHIKFDRLQTTVTIDKEKVLIGQMKIKSSAITVTGSGEHNFDNSYIYRFQVGLSDILWKKAKKRKNQSSEFGVIADDGLGRHIIPLAISGKDTIFEVKYDRKTAVNIFQDKISEEKEEWKSINNDETFIKKDSSGTQLEWDDEPIDDVKKDKKKNNENSESFKVDWQDD